MDFYLNELYLLYSLQEVLGIIVYSSFYFLGGKFCIIHESAVRLNTFFILQVNASRIMPGCSRRSNPNDRQRHYVVTRVILLNVVVYSSIHLVHRLSDVQFSFSY